MEENKDYHAYRYGDHLTPGSELKIEHSVVCENVDISTLITMGIDSLEAMRQGSIDGEQKAYEIVVAAAKQWEQQAAATQTINRALEYLRTPEIEHTGNQWKDTDNWRADQKISNRVYQMTCSIWEDTKYDRETKQSVPIAWYVTWEVRIHSPKQGYGVLWSSIFVTLMANKIGGLQFGIYRNCQISSRVFHTAVAALPLTKANRSDFE